MSSIKNSNQKKKVVILGSSPLPFENTPKTSASGIRTWYFAQAAKEENCQVLILGYRIPFSYEEDLPETKFIQKNGIDYYSISGELFEDKNWMKEKISQFDPDCIVGVNTHPSSVAANFSIDIPFWADLNGSVMAEAQAKSYVYDDNKYLEHFFKMESKVLGKADVFSVVSEPQGFSLVGELGIWGRLNKNSMGYRFVRVIPNTSENKKYKHTKNVIRNVLAKESDFVILYSGGYNTWTDVDTLFYGLQKAMEKNPKIVFVSTGGQIEGHDELTYKHFRDLVESSKFKDRFHFLGWVPNNDLPNYYLEADLAINSDKFCYEALLGARTRIMDWMRVPLTFISTPLSEITQYLIENNLAFGFNQGDSDDLSSKLIDIANNPEKLQKIKTKLEKTREDEFTSVHTFREFRGWLSNPQFSPDHNKTVNLISEIQTNNKNNKIQSTPLLEKTAVSAWPTVHSVLHSLHLNKYEDGVKRFGINMAIKQRAIDFKAKFLPVVIPVIVENEKYVIPVTVKNVGKTEWKNYIDSSNAVNLSYIWKNEKNEIVFKPEERTTLPKSLPSGKQITLDMTFTTPPKAGKYILEIDMLKEGEFWFSDAGSELYSVIVNVKKKEAMKIPKMPKASVIVITYNSEKYITECLDSIINSDYPGLEIIVVDNASKDNTLGILEKYRGKIKLLKSKKNLGFAGANNLGIQKSNGEIIVMINPDAYVKKNSIHEMILPLINDENTMISGPKILYPKTKKIQSAGGIIQKNGLSNHVGYGEEDSSQYDVPRVVDYVTGAAMAIKRRLFELTGLFSPVYNPAYYEETDKCTQAAKLKYKVVYEPKSIVYHYESTTLGTRSESFLSLFHTNRFKYIYRNCGLGSFLFDFIPAELKWFFVNCPIPERKLVIKAHFKAFFSSNVILKKKDPKLV